MRTIWKYPLNVVDKQIIFLPSDFRFLCVQIQHEEPCLWMMIDPKAQEVQVLITIHGTGHQIDASEDMQYIGTFQLFRGDFVGHVFWSLVKRPLELVASDFREENS